MVNLLKEDLNGAVQPTGTARKLTLDGVSKAYPVYRVRLDLLFYNDQNDRIATWISQYKSEQGENGFAALDRAAYNSVIERFIIQSNEIAIEKTQMNIALVGQREPGVVLSDGRVIDGNRRFTCLRRLAAKDPAFDWFETVILDNSMEANKKQIKMLELSIQHGEEKKVDYNPIDRLVGVYQDIVETGLLTVEEYAASTNESVLDVKRRIESAMLLVEFLEYIHLPKQYHIAREYQVVSLISDLQPLLRKCSSPELRQSLKEAVFANCMMHTIGDSRKYIKELSQMMNTAFFTAYMKEQNRIGSLLQAELDAAAPTTRSELEYFVSEHEEAAESLEAVLDRSVLKAKKQETRSRPSQIVSKSISLLNDVDTRIFEKLTDNEKEKLQSQLSRLATAVTTFDSMLNEENQQESFVQESLLPAEPKTHEESPSEKEAVPTTAKPRYYAAFTHKDEPLVQCISTSKPITTLSITLEFSVSPAQQGQKAEFVYRAFFIDAQNEMLSDIKELQMRAGEQIKQLFTLAPRTSSLQQCMLVLQSEQDASDEVQRLIPFEVRTAFVMETDF